MKTIKAKKSLGQNFLIDQEALTAIANAIEIWGKHIIEVGPWYGALTEYLIASKPESFDLVELDTDMLPILRETFGDQVTIHHQDVLTFTPSYEDYSVIANIPYYITSPILFHFLYDLPHAPSEMVIMMQEEVGEKILAGRNKKPHHSYLSLAMELACEDIEIVRYVGRESFDPAPKVDSIVLKFSVKKSRDMKIEDEMLALWRVAFTHPRKTLMSNLKGSHYDIERVKKWIVECWYDEKIRAEAVGMEEWKKLISKL